MKIRIFALLLIIPWLLQGCINNTASNEKKTHFAKEKEVVNTKSETPATSGSTNFVARK